MKRARWLALAIGTILLIGLVIPGFFGLSQDVSATVESSDHQASTNVQGSEVTVVKVEPSDPISSVSLTAEFWAWFERTDVGAVRLSILDSELEEIQGTGITSSTWPNYTVEARVQEEDVTVDLAETGGQLPLTGDGSNRSSIQWRGGLIPNQTFDEEDHGGEPLYVVAIAPADRIHLNVSAYFPDGGTLTVHEDAGEAHLDPWWTFTPDARASTPVVRATASATRSIDVDGVLVAAYIQGNALRVTAGQIGYEGPQGCEMAKTYAWLFTLDRSFSCPDGVSEPAEHWGTSDYENLVADRPGTWTFTATDAALQPDPQSLLLSWADVDRSALS